nr:MAG TPA: hypothetical protein [Caudoviricetes sp.]
MSHCVYKHICRYLFVLSLSSIYNLTNIMTKCSLY